MTAAKAAEVRISGGQYLLFLVLRWLVLISLGIWLCGIVGIGALTAPIAFHVIQESPTTAALTAAEQSKFAGQIIGDSLKLFNSVCGGFCIVMFFAQILTLALWPEAPRPKKRVAPAAKPSRDYSRTMLIVEFVFSLLLFSSLAYQAFYLFSAMDAAQARGAMKEFDSMHQLYKSISFGQLGVLLPLFFLFIHNTANLGRR